MEKKTKFWMWGIGILLVFSFIFLIQEAAQNSQNCATTPAVEMNIGGHENINMHIHQELTITINGESVVIPASIGLPSAEVMRPIHTHDSSGKIHVEGTCPRDFTLGEFFDVWGETFTETCIFENCVDEDHRLTMYVNGVESLQWRDLILKNEDSIEIVYEEKV